MQLTVEMLRNLVRPAAVGTVFTFQETLGALNLRCVESASKPVTVRSKYTTTVHVIGGAAACGARTVDEQDVVYLPKVAGGCKLTLTPADGPLRLLIAEYGDVKGAAPNTDAPLFIDGDRGTGYWRTQYGGPRHGMPDFNPKGVKYRDICWPYLDPAILAQTVEIPPHHMVPAHAHGRAGEPVTGAKVWQWYYCYRGRAKIHIGASVQTYCEVELKAGDVMVYPNGLAHNVLCGGEGCFYIFGEKKGDGQVAPPVLEDEFVYEKKLCTRGAMSVRELLEKERA
jgi:uncharacterized protein YjlB